nr:MAG: ORF1 [TTV-like mini virus]
MPPFRYYWRKWKPRQRRWRRRRFQPRFRRPRTTFRRGRKTRWVRRKKHRHNYKKKLKKIIIQQFQPKKIRRCKITGYLPLFQFGRGRVGNNYVMYRDSFVPDHEPGGGGFSVQQISLSSLYTDNTENLLNWWTQSNKGLNLVRFLGTKISIFRQPFTDTIFSYMNETPRTVSKYFYAGLHPIKMLNFNEKIVVPSFNTQPHKRKPYKSKFIPPPKLWKNQWYFQQQIADYPLIQFMSTACSLTGLFGSKNEINNNITLLCLNTTLFTSPHFQYRQKSNPYLISGTKYMYALQRLQLPIETHKYSQLTYLGQTMLNEPGFPRSNMNKETYTETNWGNIFYYQYLNKEELTFQSSMTFETFMSKAAGTNIDKSFFTLQTTDYIIPIRYNPWKDKGKGNKMYWVPNSAATKKNWEPTGDPDLEINDYPLWIMAYGWEDMTSRIGKAKNLDNDFILVIRSRYLSHPEKEYVILSDSFVYGQGPYGVDRSEIKGQDTSHWYPRFRYQREALNAIIESGPAIARNDYTKNEQASLKYTFYFKWGGCPSSMENIYDPKSQPITPTPNNFNLLNEIIDPQTSLENYIYHWDTRRDQLTQSATERIKTCPTNAEYMFTDGRQPAETIPLFETTQTQDKEETPQTQTETLFRQLQQLQQLNQQLQLRFLQLTSQMENT